MVSPDELRSAVADTAARVLAFVEHAMVEHQCCYDPKTAPQVTAQLMGPITEVLPASNPTDQKEG